MSPIRRFGWALLSLIVSSALAAAFVANPHPALAFALVFNLGMFVANIAVAVRDGLP